MVIINNIEEYRVTIPTPPPTPLPPTIIGQSDKKDYIIKLKKSPGDTSSNISGLRLYLGCHKKNDMTLTTSNCKLSVIDHDNQIYSAINPINPESNNTGNVLRYIIPDEDITELTRVGSSGIEIKVQLETSQDSNETRTPLGDHYVLKAHVEYVLKERIEVTQCSAPSSVYSIDVKVSEPI